MTRAPHSPTRSPRFVEGWWIVPGAIIGAAMWTAIIYGAFALAEVLIRLAV